MKIWIQLAGLKQLSSNWRRRCLCTLESVQPIMIGWSIFFESLILKIIFSERATFCRLKKGDRKKFRLGCNLRLLWGASHQDKPQDAEVAPSKQQADQTAKWDGQGWRSVNQLGFKMNNLRLQIAEESKVAGPENRDMMASMANAAKERKEKNVILIIFKSRLWTKSTLSYKGVPKS